MQQYQKDSGSQIQCQYQAQVFGSEEQSSIHIDQQSSTQSLFIGVLSSIIEQTHVHSKKCPLEWIITVFDGLSKKQSIEQITINEEMLLNYFETTYFWRILLFFFKGIKCFKCQGIYNAYLVQKYNDLLRLLIWLSRKQFCLQDYIAFFCLTDCVIQHSNPSESAQSKIIKYLSFLNYKQAQQSTNLYYFKFTLTLLQIKHQKNINSKVTQQFINKYIKQSDHTNISIIIKILYHTHSNTTLQKGIISALKTKVEKDFFPKKRQKLLQMINNKSQPKDCLCLTHIQNLKVYHQKQPILMKFKRTQSNIIEVNHNASFEKNSYQIQVSSLQQADKSKFSEKIKKDLRILQISKDETQGSGFLCQIQEESLKDAKRVKNLFDNYVTLLEMDEFIERINKTYGRSSKESQIQWKKIKQQNRASLGLIYNLLLF